MTAPRARIHAEGLYVLAYLGAHLAFMPLLVLLLPRRVSVLVESDPAVPLSWLLLTGGLVAGAANIAAGHLSDIGLRRHGNRRAIIALGTVLLAITYLLFARAQTIMALGVAIIAFQAALNLMFGPLATLLADHIPDQRKGVVAGWLNAALPLSYAGIAALAWLYPGDDTRAFLVLVLAVPLLVLPLVLFWPFGRIDPVPAIAEPAAAVAAQSGAPVAGRDFWSAWLARLLVQAGATLILGYVFVYAQSLAVRLDEAPPTATISTFIGRLSLVALVVSFLAAILIGRLSDHLGRRKAPLVAATLVAAGSLTALALADDWTTVTLAYAAFNAALAAFLAIDAAMVAQIVANSSRKGVLLGVMNLTNTLPAIITPLVGLLAIGGASVSEAFAGLLLAGAGASVLAGLLICAIRSIR